MRTFIYYHSFFTLLGLAALRKTAEWFIAMKYHFENTLGNEVVIKLS